MLARLAILLSICLLQSASADDVVDRTGKWDVNGPLGSAPKELNFSTSEGTWMNLDVHPDGTTIIFDLLGDLYVMPIAGGDATRLTSGAAYDFQPRFSPDGGQILFTSDRSGISTVWIADYNDATLSEYKNVNDGSDRTFDGANWTPDGDWIMARQRITDVSSIGIAEMWLLHKDGGSGIKIVDNKAETDSFHASADGRYLYYGESGPFSYGRNPYGPIWSVNRYDRKTGEKRPVSGGNGSSGSPVLSPDGQRIAFIRRVGSDSTIWIHDLQSGAETQLWDGLDRDQLEAFGTHHIYPNYDFTPDSASLIVWAGGKIVRVPMNGDAVSDIPFTANVELKYHAPLRSKNDPAPDVLQSKLIRWPVISPDGETLVFSALGRLYQMSLPDGEPRRVTNQERPEFAPTFSLDGRRVLFTSWTDDNGGALQEINLLGRPGTPRTLYESPAQLVNPAYSPDGDQLLVVAGSNVSSRGGDLGAEGRHDILLLNSNGRGAATVIVSTANRGSQRRVSRPTFSADGTRIWYFDDEENAGGERGKRMPAPTGLKSIRLDGTDKKTHVTFRFAQEAIVSPDDGLIAISELHNAYVMPMPRVGETVAFDPNSATLAFQQLTEDGGEWVTWSRDAKTLSYGFANQVTRLPSDEFSFGGKAKPRDLSDNGILIQSLRIDSQGQYLLGDDSLSLDTLKPALMATWSDANHVRIDVAVADDAPYSAWHELEDWAGDAKVAIKNVSAGDKKDDDADESNREEFTIDLIVPRAKPSGVLALSGARIVTMNGDSVIDDGTIVVRDNRIVAVGPSDEINIPADAKRFDVAGKTIMPGIIDVHAHLGYGVLDVNPEKEWRYYANLAYGVTTTHDPSASTHTVFGQAEMIEAGLMVGPRVFSTGFILYGATNSDMAVINSYADALSHVRRLKSQGAFSVKSYMQPRREQRQWVIRAAAAENMLVMPEGGGDFPVNVGMLLDGHSGIEHSLSVGQIYKDVVTLFAETRAGYTATLLVAYGGQEGEKYFYQHDEVWKNEKLQSFFPPRQIDARARRRVMSEDSDYNHMLVAAGQKKISDAGGLINLGAHGQLQGLGAHWELWAIAQGGMRPHDALRAATINGAEYLGMDADLGSIEVGKLADFIVLDRNPLDDIRNSESVSMTIINGVVYDANSMDQLWPRTIERGTFHFK